MNFKEHSDLVGRHAFLGASKYHWINYDTARIVSSYLKYQAIQRGTDLHAYASEAIRLGVKQAKSKYCLNQYINDAIGFRMTPEQPLYYSPNAFGTADCISFKNNVLRIHDLKTGVSPVSMKQLLIYAALFCLEYNVKPTEIEIELRIYQNDEVLIEVPLAEDVVEVMGKMILFNKEIETLQSEE